MFPWKRKIKKQINKQNTPFSKILGDLFFFFLIFQDVQNSQKQNSRRTRLRGEVDRRCIGFVSSFPVNSLNQPASGTRDKKEKVRKLGDRGDADPKTRTYQGPPNLERIHFNNHQQSSNN